ncbi:MAG: type II toxin-antitoxin system RelE/ParE family toxin [Sphingopyxis terrae]|nr:MAG: type II toxin-antitoxin system RelE/ParE family toxin [Sphingopyxis terrae]
MSRVVYQPAAQQDFYDIVEFIAQDNPDRAVSFVQEIRSACERRAELPHAGRRCDDIAPGLLRFPHKSYIIYYRMLSDGDGIRIMHIIHGARDHERIMRQHDET